MPFSFRLERVLAVRRLQEEAAQARHGRAAEELRRAEAVLADVTARQESALEELDRLKHRDELTPEALYLHPAPGRASPGDPAGPVRLQSRGGPG